MTAPRLLLLLSMFYWLPSKGVGQIDLYISVGYGVNYSITKLDKLQLSYDTYIESAEAANPGIDFKVDPNFNSTQWSDLLSFQLALGGNSVYFGMSYFPNQFIQERSVLSPSGYGRKFVWKEKRNEFLFDVGYGSRFVDIFGTFGVNSNNYRMISYQIYPDGSESLTNEYYYNGVYKQTDVGLTYGLGFKLKLIPFIALDFRYLFASHQLPGENRNNVGIDLTLTDNSDAKTVGTYDFPQDFNQPFYYTNSINPNFNKHYFSCSLLVYIRTNDNE